MSELLKVGDRAVVDDVKYPGIWIVRKVNPTRYLLDPERGGPGLNAQHHVVRAAPADGSVPSGADSLDAAFNRPTLHQGTLVRWDSTKAAPGALYVVIADKYTRVNIARLGGENGRYWRVTPRSLTVVDPADVLAEGSS